MKIEKLVKAFAALSQKTRVQILSMIINFGDDGICPCNLLENLKLTNANLSFHLKELENAGFINKKKKGRFIHYFVNCDLIEQLGNFLIKDCGKLNCKKKETKNA
ncbi:MAG: winged helix-turn-helix transcriptional regulator [Alphaproteobacteria bacterium]|nr:winged helix-turn-helix transcriptional regulator [Alphaproteobacteria bacterium]MBN2674856.1 winged helix-turn-helix transcriptional regulator [Alphaproteobacteria bacterium]